MPTTIAPPRRTTLGTFCSPAWDDAWVATVNAAEARLNHRICGAASITGDPCTLTSDHPNGRCRFHGGASLTGAQPGNRNAVIHGLYARGIQRCGQHCPLWNHCPMASQDVLDLPARERPQCPYEVAQYQAATTDALERLTTQPNTDRLDQQVACTLALVQVMLTRATAALSVTPLTTDPPTPSSPDRSNPSDPSNPTEPSSAPSASSAKAAINPPPRPHQHTIHPALQAFRRISTEYRAYLKLLPHGPAAKPTTTHLTEDAIRHDADTRLTPEAQIALYPADAPTLSEHLAATFLQQARVQWNDAGMDESGLLKEEIKLQKDLEALEATAQQHPNQPPNPDLQTKIARTKKRLTTLESERHTRLQTNPYCLRAQPLRDAAQRLLQVSQLLAPPLAPETPEDTAPSPPPTPPAPPPRKRFLSYIEQRRLALGGGTT